MEFIPRQKSTDSVVQEIREQLETNFDYMDSENYELKMCLWHEFTHYLFEHSKHLPMWAVKEKGELQGFIRHISTDASNENLDRYITTFSQPLKGGKKEEVLNFLKNNSGKKYEIVNLKGLEYFRNNEITYISKNKHWVGETTVVEHES